MYSKYDVVPTPKHRSINKIERSKIGNYDQRRKAIKQNLNRFKKYK
jgi:hypothetical protein